MEVRVVAGETGNIKLTTAEDLAAADRRLTLEEALDGQTVKERGLLFVCYVTNIAEQFEAVQSARVNSLDFVQRGAGVDAIVGQSDAEQPLQFTAATPFSNGRKPVLQFERFVHMTGGGYFFAPSVTTIRTQLARQPGGGHE